MFPQNVLMEIDDNDDTSLKDIEDRESQDPSVPIITASLGLPG